MTSHPECCCCRDWQRSAPSAAEPTEALRIDYYTEMGAQRPQHFYPPMQPPRLNRLDPREDALRGLTGALGQVGPRAKAWVRRYAMGGG